MPDKMSARCVALNVSSGDKKYIDGACVLADSDGDKIFSTFDTRDLDKSQPDMNCGTHVITGGTGKYKGITGREPFATPCPPWQVLVAILQWISPTTRRGKSGKRARTLAPPTVSGASQPLGADYLEQVSLVLRRRTLVPLRRPRSARAPLIESPYQTPQQHCPPTNRLPFRLLAVNLAHITDASRPCARAPLPMS